MKALRKASNKFVSLSRVGKISVISAAAIGVLFVSAAATPTTNTDSTSNTNSSSSKKPIVTTKVETETKPIPFEKQTVENGSLAKGVTQIQTVGVNGIKTFTHTITLTDGKETKRTSTEVITTAPVTEVTAIGTYVKPVSQCDSNYSGCVPVVSYDLDCSDIGYSVQVYGYDKHGLDGDDDGEGCESY